MQRLDFNKATHSKFYMMKNWFTLILCLIASAVEYFINCGLIILACSSVVERLTVNQDVVGSIPTLPVYYWGIAKW